MLTQPNILAAYLYNITGDIIPEPVKNTLGEIDIEADNAIVEAWSSNTCQFQIDMLRLEKFILRTDGLLSELENLKLDLSEPAPAQYMTLFYDAAKDTFDQDKTKLRTYFEWLYLVLYGKSQGSRWGDMVDVMGVANFTETVRQRFKNLL